jgi:hypothetical protein
MIVEATRFNQDAPSSFLISILIWKATSMLNLRQRGGLRLIYPPRADRSRTGFQPLNCLRQAARLPFLRENGRVRRKKKKKFGGPGLQSEMK